MRVETWYLHINLADGRKLRFDNLSRVAFKRYLYWYDIFMDERNATYQYGPNELKRSNNWLAGT